jgi:hypothetical protein
MKIYAAIVCLLLFATSLFGQVANSVANPFIGNIVAPVALGSKTEGLELPDEITVDASEGFMLVQAKSKGKVKWLVVSQSKVKYVANEESNSLVVAVPQSGSVNIFAVALVDGKLTEFAKTSISVKNNKPDPVKPIDPDKPNTKENLHITFLFDFNNSNPDLAAVLNSKTIRDEISKSKSYYKVYDINSPIVKSKKLDTLLEKTGNSLFIVQSSDGTVLHYSAIPKTEKEVLDTLTKITKGE